MHFIDKYEVISGLVISEHVIKELRKLGIALNWYNIGELEDAIIACAVDMNLIDDDDGIDFRDKLLLSHRERLLKERRAAHAYDRNDNTGIASYNQ